jgi:hypothetical protein
LVLVDGFVTARWKDERSTSNATVGVEPFRRLTAAERSEIAAEGARLLTFLHPDAGKRGVRISKPDASPPNQRPGHQPGRD